MRHALSHPLRHPWLPMDTQTRIRTHVAGVPEAVPMLRGAFHPFGSPEKVDAALAALVAEGVLLEVAEGVFGKAVQTEFGVLPGFGAWEVAKAITEAAGHQIGYIPLAWANLLHLSRQVVAKVIFMTDGPDRVIRFGKGTIRLEHASAEDVRLSQSIAGGAVLGLPHADANDPQESLHTLHRLLDPSDWATFLQEAQTRGGWIAQAVAAYDAANHSGLARRRAVARRSLRESWKRAEAAGLDRMTDADIDQLVKSARRSRRRKK